MHMVNDKGEAVYYNLVRKNNKDYWLVQVKLLFDLKEAAADAKEAKLLRLRERIIKDTGEQDYSTSLCRKWLDEHTTKTVHDAVSLASSHELKKPD